MSAQPDTEQLIALIREGRAFAPGMTLEGQEGIDQMATLLEHVAHRDFVTVMVDKEGRATEHPGVDGFREALSDWISPYESFRLVIDKALVTDDEMIVFLVRQVGTTKHDGVEIETPSGSVWGVHDGQIARATFYIDQRTALRAAGMGSSSG